MFARFFPARLPRLLPKLSVRARIAVLAMIPVAGFIANGLNYIVSEREVGQAFDGVRRSGALIDASRDLKSALDGIGFTAREMSVRPTSALTKAFANHQANAKRSLEEIQKNGDPEDTRTIPHILRTV